MSGHSLREQPVPKIPPGPAPGENITHTRVSHTHIEGADSGEYCVLKEEGADGAYIASTVTVAEYEP